MTEMIERVAKAIEDTYDMYADPTPAQRARAAIEAMREPTTEMIAAGSNFAWFEGRTNDLDDAATTWRAMIDAATPPAP